MVTIFEALADPTRRRILELLREKPRLVGDLADLLEISQPGTSKQLKLLRDAGLVRVRQDAQRRWYELRPEPLAELDKWLSPYRQLWEARYNRLDNLLDELQQEDNNDEQT
jgi:DNA-binding transcriptional ArsR family regulator